MDDFGTGYSSLSCLHRFPLDALKIDRAFVRNYDVDRDYRSIIHAIITLAKNLGMRVTIEGVEKESQLAMVMRLNCDFAQGCLFSRPLSPEAATDMLLEGPAWKTKWPLSPQPAEEKFNLDRRLA